MTEPDSPWVGQISTTGDVSVTCGNRTATNDHALWLLATKHGESHGTIEAARGIQPCHHPALSPAVVTHILAPVVQALRAPPWGGKMRCRVVGRGVGGNFRVSSSGALRAAVDRKM